MAGRTQQQGDVRSATCGARRVNYMYTALWDFGEQKSHSIWILANGRGFLISGRGADAEIGQKGSEHGNCKYPGNFTIVTDLYVNSCVFLSIHTIFLPRPYDASPGLAAMMKEITILSDSFSMAMGIYSILGRRDAPSTAFAITSPLFWNMCRLKSSALLPIAKAAL